MRNMIGRKWYFIFLRVLVYTHGQVEVGHLRWRFPYEVSNFNTVTLVEGRVKQTKVADRSKFPRNHAVRSVEYPRS